MGRAQFPALCAFYCALILLGECVKLAYGRSAIPPPLGAAPGARQRTGQQKLISISCRRSEGGGTEGERTVPAAPLIRQGTIRRLQQRREEWWRGRRVRAVTDPCGGDLPHHLPA